ncbi:uncharacterized protein N7496_001850 [Penicillium cataractarum]|uniref:Uncharacterized protein n=1 Tax=Penicillium cataractarum TaxID=2100454 RepID=A0A9W9VWR4_9EURO|nr:uncharacterized protein N7496_001850 [Penicillium cataractarum]KAJ5390782.1 hypothetical protein N7496_001850 [Penicillium cataractarum]
MVIQLIQQAAKRQAELRSKLEEYSEEVGETKRIVELVQNEDALQTSGAVAMVRRVENLGQGLKRHLMSMGQPKSALRQFGHQLISGSEDEAQLASFMVRLGRAKQDLILQIQVANVGLAKSINNTLLVEMATVNKLHALLQETLGEGKGLKIAEFLRQKGAVLEGSESIQLSDAEYDKLQTEEREALHPEPVDAALNVGGRRIIVDNLTRDQALQINGPVAVDIWKDMAFIKIEGNIASDTAIQTNYPVSMDVFRELLAARAAGIGSR